MNNLLPVAEIRNFEDLFTRLFSEQKPTERSLTIPLDIVEVDGKVMIKAAMPGIDPSEIEVSVENNVLTIRGEHKSEELSEDAKMFRRENVYGVFSRSLRLQPQLDQSAIEASFKNGIVTVTIPKIEEQKPAAVRIPITSVN
ncbi:MAG TPA: Hsp20/alpha crystallin family protein [Fimbriimonas sp.]|nr:Hsp20/alpha crystallin family protein [Fimbriimonas sp.]